jgi:anaerobic selenocysteine-containing dehydrogenase
VYSLPDTESVKKAFEKIPFIVCFSSYPDETTAMADLLLPNHIYLERYEDVPAAQGFPKPIISLTRPAVEPLYDTRPTGDFIIQLAKALGGNIGAAFPWDEYGACLEETLGDRWDALVEEGYWVDDEFSGADWVDAFETVSTKFEFTNSDIRSLVEYHPVKLEGDESLYPLVLIPYDTMRLTSGYIATPPFLVKALEDTILKGNDVLVEVNPATAKPLGLLEGKYASLTTLKGSVRVKTHLTNRIMPGVIAIPRGLGRTNVDRFLAGRGINYNQFSSPAEDPASGYNAAWGIRAKLSKA